VNWGRIMVSVRVRLGFRVMVVSYCLIESVPNNLHVLHYIFHVLNVVATDVNMTA